MESNLTENDINLRQYYQDQTNNALNNSNPTNLNLNQSISKDFDTNSKIENENDDINLQNYYRKRTNKSSTSPNASNYSNSHNQRNIHIRPNFQPNKEEIMNNKSQINQNQTPPYIPPNYPANAENTPLISTQHIYKEQQNIYKEQSNSNQIQQIAQQTPNNLPKYISATPRLLADIDNYDVGNFDCVIFFIHILFFIHSCYIIFFNIPI